MARRSEVNLELLMGPYVYSSSSSATMLHTLEEASLFLDLKELETLEEGVFSVDASLLRANFKFFIFIYYEISFFGISEKTQSKMLLFCFP